MSVGMIPLVVERSGHTTRLTLNRPEQADALDAPAVEALLAELVRSAAIPGLKARIQEFRARSS